MRPCGCAFATRLSSRCTECRTAAIGLWMRAMICGVTSSHVSIGIVSKPCCTASSTAGLAPYLNHIVSRRNVSWSARSRPRAIERTKPLMAGTTYARPCPCETASKWSIAHSCHALYDSGLRSVACPRLCSTTLMLFVSSVCASVSSARCHCPSLSQVLAASLGSLVLRGSCTKLCMRASACWREPSSHSCLRKANTTAGSALPKSCAGCSSGSTPSSCTNS